MIFKPLSAIVLATALLLPIHNTAHAGNSMFENLVGSWKGRGVVTPNLGSKEENIRCRLSNRKSRKPGRLNVIGNCSVAGLLLPVNGWIKRKAKTKLYTAALFQSLTRLSSNNFSGKLEGKKLSLAYLGVDKDTKQQIKASIIVISKSAENFDIQIKRVDPASKKIFDVGTIKFSKR